MSRGSFPFANSECRSVPAATGELARMENFLQYKYTGQLSLKFGYMFEDFGAGRNGIYFREPFREGDIRKSYESHTVLEVLNYDFWNRRTSR